MRISRPNTWKPFLINRVLRTSPFRTGGRCALVSQEIHLIAYTPLRGSGSRECKKGRLRAAPSLFVFAATYCLQNNHGAVATANRLMSVIERNSRTASQVRKRRDRMLQPHTAASSTLLIAWPSDTVEMVPSRMRQAKKPTSSFFRSDDVLVDLPSKAIRKLVELGLSAKKSGAKVKT